MPVHTRIQRIALRTIAILAGTAVVAFAILVLVRLMAHSSRAEAASVIYYPNFCLGGWKYPQHASGPAAVASSDPDPASFTADNSAYLESSTASQIFCGYFSVRNAKNPPKKAVVSFNWNFAFPGSDALRATSTPESYTSPEGYISVPAAGIMISATTTTATSTFPANIPPSSLPPVHQNDPGSNNSSTPVAPSIPQPALDQGASSGTTEVAPTPGISTGSAGTPSQGSSDASPSDSAPATTPPEQVPAAAPSTAPDPAPTPAVPEAPATPSSEAPQGYDAGKGIGSFIASLIAEKVEAAVEDEAAMPAGNQFRDFLEISYSLDGIRWTSVGRVNKDNWKGYKVEVPVNSWDEVKRLQIMISVLPTLDVKPDIYLDSISMRAEYTQTVSELAAQGFAAVSNAVDTLIGDGNGAVNALDILPEEKKAPQPIEIRKKKLSFSLRGDSLPPITGDDASDPERALTKISSKKGIRTAPNADGSSLVISGSCSKKYFVVLTYRRETDYVKKISSSIVNEAHECSNGTFSYDMASLSPDTTRDGSQYLLIAEQDETGPWVPISDIYPILIQASTTVETIYQQP